MDERGKFVLQILQPIIVALLIWMCSSIQTLKVDMAVVKTQVAVLMGEQGGAHGK